MKKSFALTGRRHLDCLTQGVALGYREIGLSARPSAMMWQCNALLYHGKAYIKIVNF